ncbi:DUF5687 family protein [Postechiella marina]|uniref:DUF5687 family protein n=1 Tax=Postechiella marina TaxID=943941 RepID=A0ABP8C568_9FLAO
MFNNFLKLEWKSFFRSANFGKSMGIKVLMGFFAVYFMLMFLILGFAMDKLLADFYPELDAFTAFNKLIFFWILGDLMLRFFFQKLPVVSVKPLLILPIKRSAIVNFVLAKSVISVINILPLFAIVPFGLKLISSGSNNASVIFTWMIIIVLLTLINNFINFIIESFSAESELSFLPIIVIASVLYGLNYFNIISFSNGLSNSIIVVANNPVLIFIPVAILIVLYVFNFKILRNKLFLDSSLKTKVARVSTSNLDWTKNFGDIAPFMQLDLKLIWRNKRSKSTLWMLGLGLFYGLLFFSNPDFANQPWLFVFVGIFSTGIFLMNFGQFIPAWDSSYYKLLMSQNIKYEKYLKSKFTLMALSVIILFVLSVPYVYFGWKILLAYFAATIYNVGINTHVIMYGGSFNRKKINLDQKAVFNYQGTGAVQWLIGIPILLLPAIIFGVFYAVFNFEIGCLVLGLMGVMGIVFHQKLMKFIADKYLASKYEMISAFNQEN